MSETRVIAGLSVVLWLTPTTLRADVLFLAHWNDALTADAAKGRAEPLVVKGTVPPRIHGGGYAYKGSMPAVNGLEIGADSILGYESAGNLQLEEGTIDFWLYPKADFRPGPAIPALLNVNPGPPSSDSWKNMMSLLYGGWNDVLQFVMYDAEGNHSGVGYDTGRWKANTRWHRVTVTWSKKRQRLVMYVDGRLAGVSNKAPFWSEVPHKLYIGNMAEWHGISPHGYDELRILDREISEVEAAADACRTHEFTPEDTFRPRSLMVPLDISTVAKTPFEDDEANDQKGGWTDQGPANDMRNIARGDLELFGIPFRVGDGCVVLSNAKRKHYPTQAEVAVNARYAGLLLVHTSAWTKPDNRLVAQYVLTYADGSEATLPLRGYEDIADWWVFTGPDDRDLPNARFVLGTPGGGPGTVGAYLRFWRNPHPGKVIRSLTYRTADGPAMPILIAITGVKPGGPEHLYAGIDLLTHERADIASDFAESAEKYRDKLGGVPSIRSSLAELVLTERHRGSFSGREAARHLAAAETYLRDAETFADEIELAVTKNDYSKVRTIEKARSYVHYAGEIVKLVGPLRAKAETAEELSPFQPMPLTSSPEANAAYAKHERAEIVLNGRWDSQNAEEYGLPTGTWEPLLIPVHYYSANFTWLRRFVPIPPAWAGRRIELKFESCRTMTEVYVNRRYVTRHTGIGPFTVDVSDAITAGAANEILLLVVHGSRMRDPYCNGNHHVTTPWDQAAMTQDVSLCVSPRVSVSSPYAWLDDSGNLVVWGTVKGATGGFEVAVSIDSEERSWEFGKLRIRPDAEGRFRVKTPWKDPVLWGIGGEYEAPNLVRVRLILLDLDGRRLDELAFRTGFRRFGIVERTRFALNGRDLVLQGDHMWSAEGHNSDCTRAFLSRYYRLAREANFNCVRFHVIDGANTYPAALDVADELGFLLEPEGPALDVPRLLDGTLNFDDPVLRPNVEKYFRAFARKVRTHPSVVVFSLSNEIFQVTGPHLPDASKFYLHMEAAIRDEMPNVVLTQQGNNARPEFATMDVHYSGGIAFKDHHKTGTRPLVHGEWSFYEGGYFGMNQADRAKAAKAMKYTANSFENAIREEIANGVAGTMPFPAFHIYSFSTAGQEFMGPWADLLEDKVKDFSRWYMPSAANVRVEVNWPALSGKGVKIDSIMTGTQADNLNFFDPTRVEFTPNAVYHGMKRGFDPMPPLSETRCPEVIVTVDAADADRPALASSPGEPCLLGVMPDAAGRAWFVLPQPGRYAFSHDDGVELRSRTFDAVAKPLKQPPGFAYIDEVRLTPY